MKKKKVIKGRPVHSVAPSRVNHPSHYGNIKLRTTGGQIVEVETVDIMEALFPHDIHLAQAIKYFARAGKKKSTSFIEDVAKGIWWCNRCVNAHGGHPDVKPGDTSLDLSS